MQKPVYWNHPSYGKYEKWYDEALNDPAVYKLLNDYNELDINDINILENGCIIHMETEEIFKGYNTITFDQWKLNNATSYQLY